MYKVELRHFQTVDTDGQPYRWTGTTPSNLTKQKGNPDAIVPQTVYFVATEDVLNLEDISIQWSVGDNDQHLKQVISEELEFTGTSAAFIRDWIVNRAYSPLNIVECRLTDTVTDKVIGEFLIKPQKISFCLYSDCNVNVTVVQNDLFFDCISKTPIADNWNGILNRGFRAYDYCVEKRPAVMTAILLSLGAIMLVFGLGMIPLSTVINFLFRLVGSRVRLPTFSDYIQAFWQLVGMGRVHAVAGARDYTKNVCDKCGVTVDTEFNFLHKQQIEHRGQTIDNPFFWLDILFAQSQKGRKNNDSERFKLLEMNIPLIGLDSLYNDLAKVFNAKWYITTNGKLRFMLKQEFDSASPVLDFDNFADDTRILKLCHDITDKTQPLTAEYGYQQDTTDLSANDALLRYNSRASFDSDGSVNPNLKGNADFTVPFGTTRFRDDNLTKDYIDEATGDPIVFIGAFAVMMIATCFFITSVGLITTLFGSTGGIPLGVIAAALIAMAVAYIAGTIFLDLSFTDAIVMSQDTCSLPKLLIRSQKQDGQIDDARAENGGTGASKVPNTLFNPLSKSYSVIHDYNAETVENLRNYPLFFDTRFQNNVFDICWSKNDFRLNAVTQRETTVEFIACDDDLNALGVYENQDIAIDKKFRFPQEIAGNSTFVTNTSRIENIKVNFMSRKVELKGTNFN